MSKRQNFEPNNILGWTEQDFEEVIYDHAKASMNGCLPLTKTEIKVLSNGNPRKPIEEDLIIALENILWLCVSSPSITQIELIAKDALKKVNPLDNI